MDTQQAVSVVMAAYNASRTIREAIDSVLAQSVSALELIVVDNCSSDDTAAIVSAYPDARVRLVRSEKNRGAAASRYAGVESARYDWVAILDSDDRWLPDKLEKQLRLQRQSGAELVFTGSGFMNAEGVPLRGELHVPQRIGYRELLKQNVISNSSVLVKKELFLRYSPRIENMHEDYACWLGLLRDGHSAAGIDEPLLIYRLSSGSKSGNKLRSAKMNWNTLRYNGLSAAEAAYYMLWYAARGLKKYRALDAKKS